MVTRSGLPQNWQNSYTLVDPFDSIDGWSTPVDGGSVELDTAHFQSGSAAVKVTCNANNQWTTTEKTVTPFSVFVRDCFFLISIYLHNAKSEYASVTFQISDGTNKWDTVSLSGYLSVGWNTLTIFPSYWAASSTIKKTKTKIRVGAKGTLGYSPSITFDSLWVCQKRPGNYMFSFDGDEDETVYTVMYPLMAARGFRGTLYVLKDRVGSTKNCTLSQLHELYDAGWAIANHSVDHADFTTYTGEQAYDDVFECREFLLDNGFTRSAYHFSYPRMQYNDITDAAIAPLCETIRRGYASDANRYPFPTVGGVPCLHTTSTLSNTISNATIDADIANIIFNGGTRAMLGHGIEDPPVNTAFCSTAAFTYLLDRVEYSRLNVITIDEWYNGLTNPRYRSLPVGRA